MSPTRLAFFLAGLVLAARVAAAPGLPDGLAFEPGVPAPAEVLGFAPGERHPRHDQVIAYFEALAAASDRVRIEFTGETHGGRPLMLAYFARPDRLADLEALRAARQDASRKGEGPAVVWLGYSVHGDEASGASAAMVTAWHLAASRDPEVLDWLDNMIVVMEPALNPDGLDRFAHWANMHRGRHPAADPLDREHNEAWPEGRTNYYWFDLNRDWLPLVHPESRARVRNYHAWRPHVITDAHEMGSDATYFFQPGVPERANPLIPARNQELTARIGSYHGAILDAAGEPYFTREQFDDYYVGKGSTYPDVTGSIGILFEQGSARGHLIDTSYGQRSFADAIANQVRTSISTLRAGRAMTDELVAYQAEFFTAVRAQARRDGNAGWLLADAGDPMRARPLLEMLLGHGVEVRPVVSDSRQGQPGQSWFIPAQQDQYLLLRAMFDVSAEPSADIFYDVSAWPLQRAYNLPVTPVRRAPDTGAPLQSLPDIPSVAVPAGAVAWLVPWDQHRAPALLAALLAEGYRVQAVDEPLVAATTNGPLALVRGSLVIHGGIQPEQLPPVAERLAALAPRYGVRIGAATSGLSETGIDLGAPGAAMLVAPRVAMLTGHGLNPYSAGYTWHWFDTRLEQPLTQVDWHRLPQRLDGFTHVVLPDGDYGDLPESVGATLVEFVRGGGQLIAVRRAARWVEDLELDWNFIGGDAAAKKADDTEAAAPAKEPQPAAAPERRPYGAARDDRGRERIGGSVLRMQLDNTHPLGFGYAEEELSVMRRGAHVLRAVDNPYVQPGTYGDDPLVAGYLSERNRERLAGGTALAATRHGAGLVVRMADDYLFRGYWQGTERLFANALFFGSLVDATPGPGDD
jgi:hypothetical protein